MSAVPVRMKVSGQNHIPTENMMPRISCGPIASNISPDNEVDNSFQFLYSLYCFLSSSGNKKIEAGKKPFGILTLCPTQA